MKLTLERIKALETALSDVKDKESGPNDSKPEGKGISVPERIKNYLSCAGKDAKNAGIMAKVGDSLELEGESVLNDVLRG
jgi:hypothetical protein